MPVPVFCHFTVKITHFLLGIQTDIDAMLAYARAASDERDYEAVVSTLERLLDIEPGNAQARFELAVAYCALGRYGLGGFTNEVQILFQNRILHGGC